MQRKNIFISILVIIMIALLIVDMVTWFLDTQALILTLLPILIAILLLLLKKEPISTRAMIRYIKDYQAQGQRSQQNAERSGKE